MQCYEILVAPSLTAFIKKYGEDSICLSLLPFQSKQPEQLHSTAVAEPPGPVASDAAFTVLTESHLKFG